jgi:small-conductance mechanosensitive channel
MSEVRIRNERHTLDLFSLLAGILFVGLGFLFVADESSGLDVEPRWILASLLVGLGLAGIAGSLARTRSDENGRQAAEEPDERDALEAKP